MQSLVSLLLFAKQELLIRWKQLTCNWSFLHMPTTLKTRGSIRVLLMAGRCWRFIGNCEQIISILSCKIWGKVKKVNQNKIIMCGIWIMHFHPFKFLYYYYCNYYKLLISRFYLLFSKTKEIEDVIYNPIFKANLPSLNSSYLHFTNTSVKWRLVSVCTSVSVLRTFTNYFFREFRFTNTLQTWLATRKSSFLFRHLMSSMVEVTQEINLPCRNLCCSQPVSVAKFF